jgi:uncharacterized protein YqhQ
MGAESAKPYIGGQAVIEGVMMRAPSSFAIVVRRADGSLHVRERPITDPRKSWEKWPFVRGVASLGESLRLGGESLKFSAEQFEKDMAVEDRKAAAKRLGPGANILTALTALTGLGTCSALAIFGTRVVAFLLSALRGFGLSLFLVATESGSEGPTQAKKASGGFGLMAVVMVMFLVFLPQGAASLVNRALHLGLELRSPGFQVLTGAFKLTIVVSYLSAIRRIKDIRRVFQYHGAEHKTISTYEANEALTVENARRKTTLHPRCGTTFLVMVALVSVIVFTAVGSFLPRFETGNELLNNLIFFLEKLPFLPVIASVTFEIQRIFARHFTRGPLRLFLWPGFLVQKITTIEPDDAQLEVALASLRVTLFREEGRAEASTADVSFPDYQSVLDAERLRPA